MLQSPAIVIMIGVDGILGPQNEEDGDKRPRTQITNQFLWSQF
jgi:hypothetical protein